MEVGKNSAFLGHPVEAWGRWLVDTLLEQSIIWPGVSIALTQRRISVIMSAVRRQRKGQEHHRYGPKNPGSHPIISENEDKVRPCRLLLSFGETEEEKDHAL